MIVLLSRVVFLAVLFLSFAVADVGRAAASLEASVAAAGSDDTGATGCGSPGEAGDKGDKGNEGDEGDEGDSDGHWAADAVAFVRGCGFFGGDLPPARYGRTVTPDEWNAMAAAVLGAPPGRAKHPDDPRYWVWLYTGGLAGGEGMFGGKGISGGGGIERQWAAGGLMKLLSMFIELPLSDRSADLDEQYLGRFRDASTIGHANRALVAAAISLGLVSGYPDGSLRPAQFLTIAEAATLLRRTRDLVRPRRETSVTLLDLPLGPEVDRPGATPERVGGISPQGPLSFATGPGESIYLLDSARGRILKYGNGRLKKVIDAPFLEEAPGSLLIHNGLIYVRDGRVEYEIAEDGRIRRMGFTGEGAIYPRPRPAGPILSRADETGNGYNAEYVSGVWTVRRVDGRGRETARAPAPPGVVDWYVSPEGGVYALTWTYDSGLTHDSGTITRAAVHRVLAPVRALEESSPDHEVTGSAAEPPIALGYPAPHFLQVRTPGWPATEIRDPVVINNLWRLLSHLGKPEPVPEWLRASKDLTTFTVTAHLPGGAGPEFLFGDHGIVAGDRYYQGSPAAAASSLLASMVFSPVNLMLVVASGPVWVTIPDLPGIARELTATERRQLGDAILAGSFRAGRHEPPQPLEDPFPRYALRIGLKGGGEATATLAGDRYLYLRGRGVAVAHRGQVARLVREWLPVPTEPKVRPDEVAYLYGATSLTIAQGGYAQDLTRWKATVVRALLGASPTDSTPVSGEPLLLTFTVAGKPHEVIVTEEGFSYGGKDYRRPGLLWLAHLQGVP